MNSTLEIITKEGKKHFREINKRRGMENIEWLEKVRKADGDVDEAIKEAKCGLLVDEKAIGKVILEYRKIKALEIIAEELINNNSTLRTLVTTLENIETAIIQRG